MDNILITGGTGKIGGQLVAHFHNKGWNVITTSRNKENIYKLNERGLLSKRKCSNISVIEVDFSKKDAVELIVNFFKKNSNLLPKVLVNNARSTTFLTVNKEGITERDFLINEYLIDVIIPYELSIQLCKFKESPLKSIINVSSIYGIVPFNPNLYDNYLQSAPIQYSLAKAAIIHLTKELAVRFSPKRIRVNTVSYGGIEGRVDAAFKEKYATLCPEGNMLTEKQTIGPVRFLASDDSIGVTGHNLIQDGGWTIW